jgi:hypothetical protein
MTEGDRRGYEMRLLEFFPRTPVEPGQGGAEAAPPEWLMTGVWVTVPPQKAERLSPDARSFANEFVPDREHAVARAGDPPPVPGEEAETPPHGDKIR